MSDKKGELLTNTQSSSVFGKRVGVQENEHSVNFAS